MSSSTTHDLTDAFGNRDRRSVGTVLRDAWTSFHPRVDTMMKRALDIAGATALIVVLLPLLLSVSFLVRRGSPGPVIYGHERIGRNGRRFQCLKFRSMVVDSDRALARHLATSQAAREEWAETRKLRDDPRITPIGAVLRKLSIDELPQLWNVLIGDMSLVGPRPVVYDELEFYGRSARYYLRTRPGITGLWQVSGRSEMTYRRRVALDRTYVVRCGSFSDLLILLRTIPAVLKSRGAW